MAAEAAAMSSLSLLLNVIGGSLVFGTCIWLARQFFQSKANQAWRIGAIARIARRRGNRRRGLRMAVTKIDQRRDRVTHRLRRAPVFERARQMHNGRIEVRK